MEKVTQVMPGGGRNRSGGARGSSESGRETSAASERDATARPGSQQSVLGSASRGIPNFLIPDFDSVNHVNRANNSLPHFDTDFLTGTQVD
jgi:hypothetical protein